MKRTHSRDIKQGWKPFSAERPAAASTSRVGCQRCVSPQLEPLRPRLYGLLFDLLFLGTNSDFFFRIPCAIHWHKLRVTHSTPPKVLHWPQTNAALPAVNFTSRQNAAASWECPWSWKSFWEIPTSRQGQFPNVFISVLLGLDGSALTARRLFSKKTKNTFEFHQVLDNLFTLGFNKTKTGFGCCVTAAVSHFNDLDRSWRKGRQKIKTVRYLKASISHFRLF